MHFSRRDFLQLSGVAALTAMNTPAQAKKQERPNILWLSTEDMSSHLGCYGDPHANTPNLDALAARGVRYTHAFTTAGVCAPCRSGIITGMYASTLGSHQMRSGGGGKRANFMPELPTSIHCFPELLREAGYYCTNNSKKDYNFRTKAQLWDESSRKAHWKNREPKQPFFAVFNQGITHESRTFNPAKNRLPENQRPDPSSITPPPFHPDTPKVRAAWGHYYETITIMDTWVGAKLKELEEAGLAEDTIVIFWSDHGDGLPRGKRFIYDSGTRIPVIVYIPEKWRVQRQGKPGTVDNQLVSSIDFGPTTLNLAGVEQPAYVQGQAFLGGNLPEPREYVYAAADRFDDRYDIIRMVRDKRYQYIRNYQPYKPYLQYITYREQHPIQKEFRRLLAEGQLDKIPAWMLAKDKPIEELYDTESDPHEMNNLAGDPAMKPVLERLRKAHEQWYFDSKDLGLIPEPELVELAKRFGYRYHIWDGLEKQEPGFMKALLELVRIAAQPGPGDVDTLQAALAHTEPSMRYWGVMGLSQLKPFSQEVVKSLKSAMDDDSVTVHLAAASALLQAGEQPKKALTIIEQGCVHANEWNRVQAVTALDEAGEAARPALETLKKCTEDQYNKYVVRIANHALGVLAGQ